MSATVNGVEPSSMGCAGWKLQEDPVGSPEQLSVTAPVNPKPGPGVSRMLVEPPPVPEMVTFPGFAEI